MTTHEPTNQERMLDQEESAQALLASLLEIRAVIREVRQDQENALIWTER